MRVELTVADLQSSIRLRTTFENRLNCEDSRYNERAFRYGFGRAEVGLSTNSGNTMPTVAYAFVDGGYLRARAHENGVLYPLPLSIVNAVANRSAVNTSYLRRLSYYDAEPDSPSPNDELEKYWETIQRFDDHELRFGYLRGKAQKRPAQQKAVDVLLSVDLVVGAFNGLFDTALLIAGDLDFLPAIHEVRRRGVRVVLGAFVNSCHEQLRAEADRFVAIDPAWCQTTTF